MSKRLGKGLGALIPGQDMKKTNTPNSDISIDLITPNPNQPRKHFDEAALIELSKSIKEYGVLSPLVLTPFGDGYEIIAGERRFRASKIAGLSKVPAIVRDVTTQNKLELAIVENVQREDLGVLEEAISYQRLMNEFNLTQNEISHKVSKSISSISNKIRLLSLNPAVQNALQERLISEGHARSLLRFDHEKQLQVLDLILKNGLSVRDVEKISFDKTKIVKKTKDQNFQKFDSQVSILRDALGTHVKINGSKSKGRIEIRFGSEDELESVIKLLLTHIGSI